MRAAHYTEANETTVDFEWLRKVTAAPIEHPKLLGSRFDSICFVGFPGQNTGYGYAQCIYVTARLNCSVLKSNEGK